MLPNDIYSPSPSSNIPDKEQENGWERQQEKYRKWDREAAKWVPNHGTSPSHPSLFPRDIM
jgi:hypothetical protein